MATTKLRDIDICVEDDTLKVIPYKLRINRDGWIEGDYSTEGQGKVLSVSMKRKDNYPLIDYILERDHTLRGDWEGFSEWDTTERFYDNPEPMPPKIQKWLQAMPDYEVRFPQ